MKRKKRPPDLMELLEAKGKTAEELADALNVSARAVYYWLSGEREPRLSVAQMQTLCSFLDCSIHDIPQNFARKNG